jgi:hypothetical protein
MQRRVQPAWKGADWESLKSTAWREDFEALKGISSRADLDGPKSTGGQTEMLWRECSLEAEGRH